MYREFFGLQLKPFSITPDPRFLYMSPGHKEALAHLLYGLKEGSGFVVITGEVGTGKTTILNAFLLKLPPRMPKVVIKNPHIRPENLYYLLGEAIGIPEQKRSRDFINGYEERLKEMGGAVLIVDESQGLSEDMLEEIRLLSNLETVNEKLVQIMLLGQQELNEKLKSPSLRQLKQRIGIKYHIPPLDSNETRDYIDHRLRVAGYEPMEKPLFTVSALTEIYKHSKGYPRLINVLCDNVLIAAYTESAKQINVPLVRKVASDLENTYTTGKSSKLSKTFMAGKNTGARIWSLAAVILLLVLLGAGAFWFFLQGGSSVFMKNDGNPLGMDAQVQIPDDASSPSPSPDAVSPAGEGPPSQPVRKIITEKVDEEGNPGGLVPAAGSPQGGSVSVKNDTVVTINEGDTVAKVAADYYGRVDEGVLSAVKAANPGIANPDLVHKGQKINLPRLETRSQVLFSVSVVSYRSIDEAKKAFSELIAKGNQATIYPYLDEQQNTLYRVTIGTYTSRQEAIDQAKQLRDKGFTYAKPVKISMEE